ncbi:MAG: phosphoribosylformylglycinamidine synthase subunit PurQ [Candidatus Ozemobacteraceae bacterium]
MKPVRALVVTGFGVNCEEETSAAFNCVQAEADIVHLNDLFHGRCSLESYDVLALPGGFSFGDDLDSGRVLADKLRYKPKNDGKLLFDDLREFLHRGKFIIGICNGFQALVKAGFLPNVDGVWNQEVTLAWNDSRQFEDRWVRVAKNPLSKTPFLEAFEEGDLPVRHGEGKLLIGEKRIRDEIIRRGLNCLTYCDDTRQSVMKYPENPNGSEISCAGLTDTTGQIFGLMPHPEAYITRYTHPDWKKAFFSESPFRETGDGLSVFHGIVKHIERSRERSNNALEAS